MTWIKYDSRGNKLVEALTLTPMSSAGVSNVGNTAGNTGIQQKRQVLAATGVTGPGKITLSQSTATGVNPNTIWINGKQPMSRLFANSAAMYSLSSSTFVPGSISLLHIQVEEPLSFTKIAVPISMSLDSAGNANTAAWILSATAMMMTVSDYTTSETRMRLAPFTGLTSHTTYSYASNTAVYDSLTGARLLTFPISGVLSAGEYYFGLAISTTNGSSIGTATTALGGSLSMLFGSTYSVLPWRVISDSTANAMTNIHMLQGVYTFPSEGWQNTLHIAFNIKTGTAGARAAIMAVFEAQEV